MLPQYYEAKKTVLPILLARGSVVFPNQVIHFDLESEEAESVLEWATRNHSPVVVVSMLDPTIEEPKLGDFAEFGTISTIRQSFRLPGGPSKVVVEGNARAKITRIVRTDPYIEGEVLEYTYSPNRVEQDEKLKNVMRLTANAAVNYLKESMQVPEVFLFPLLDAEDPGMLSDELASHLDLRHDEELDLLEELDLQERLYKLRADISLLTKLSRLDKEINEKAQERLQQSQKEFVLREQINILREELGETEGNPDSLVEEYKETFDKLPLSDEARAAVESELDRLTYLSPMSPDVNVSRTYLDTLAALPWGKYTEDVEDLSYSRKILDRDHYGLREVKERILEFIAVRQLRKDSKGSILCFVGPPGVGKTSIARGIAAAIGRKFVSMRLGGVSDEAEIRGHRKTYVGAMPGRIIYHMTKANSMNPVFLLDEVDKIGSDFRGDPASALLEVLDPEQNTAFQDRFLEIPFDLSQVMFITTANTTETIPRPLLDRMEVIRIEGYTDREKMVIAKRHLLPKARKESGLTTKQISFPPAILEDVLHFYTREAGVRELERQIEKVCRRAAKRIVLGEKTVHIGKRTLPDFLGMPKYADEPIAKTPP